MSCAKIKKMLPLPHSIGSYCGVKNFKILLLRSFAMDDFSYRGSTRVSEDGGSIFSTVNATQRFMTGVYMWMAGALVVSALAAVLTIGPVALNPNASLEEAVTSALSTPLGSLVFGSRFGHFILLGLELALVFYLSLRITKMSRVAAMLAFLGFATLNGVTMSSIFLVYSLPSITTAFFISAAMFGGMSLFGIVTKRDLSKIGSICGMALWGVIIASLVNMFLRSSGMSWIISFVTVIVFTGLTAYDTQKLKNMATGEEGTDMYVKYSLIGALSLYLDFINMFLAILRIFGRSRD
jgi:FtsH-binding integral membrane protein